MAHYLGPGTAKKVLAADPGAQLSDVVSPWVITANPWLKGKSIGDFRGWVQGKFENKENPMLADTFYGSGVLADELDPRDPRAQQYDDLGPLAAYWGGAMNDAAAARADAASQAAPAPQAQSGPYSDKPIMNDGIMSPGTDALLRFGAGMLSGRNFMDGLGRGLSGVADVRQGLQQRILEAQRQQRLDNQVKRTPLANGAFIYEQYPDGTSRVVPNKDVQEFQRQQSQDKFNQAAQLIDLRKGVGGSGGRPLPQGQQKSEDSDLENVDNATNIADDIEAQADAIQRGDFGVNLMDKAGYALGGLTGLGGPETARYNSFRATLEKMRNDSLRLNKGVQTEGDAQRAWNELFTALGANDKDTVEQRLRELALINRRAANQIRRRIDIRRQRNSAEPFDWGNYENMGSPLGNGGAQGADSFEIDGVPIKKVK
jgi:hypothetical protein